MRQVAHYLRVFAACALLLAAPRPAWAREGIATLYFFAGWGSTKAQADAWEIAVRARIPSADLDIRAIPYPAGASDNGTLVARQIDKDLEAIATTIAQHPEHKTVVACHSSGCGIANVLVEKVLGKDIAPARLRLVNLDGGFQGGCLPTKRIFETVATECWSARDPKGKTTALNYKDAEKHCPAPTQRVLEAEGCKSGMCLHFKLINAALGEGTAKRDFIRTGYDKLDPNLEWLQESALWLGLTITPKAEPEPAPPSPPAPAPQPAQRPAKKAMPN